MGFEKTLSGRVLSQISLMQSVITNLPNIKSMMNFASQGLKDLPGVKDIQYKIFEDDKQEDEYKAQNKSTKFDIKTADKNLASFYLFINDREAFNPYIPYVDNFCYMLAIVLEEKNQRMINDKLLIEMEDLVKKRTHDLQVTQERLSIALSGANSGIWDWKIKTGEIYYDKNYYMMAGYEPYEFPATYDEWKKRIHIDDIQNAEKAMSEYIKGTIKKYEIEFRFKTKIGKWMWILSKGKISKYDEMGKAARFTGLHTDISNRKKVEKKLFKAQYYISNIMNSMPSIIICVDSNRKIKLLNKNAEDLAQSSSSELIGRNFSNTFPQYKNEISKIDLAISSNKELCIRRKAIIIRNKIHYKNIVIFPLILEDKQSAVIRIDDVTEQMQIEEILVQNEKMLSVGGLAAGMAHEINNPLGGMIQTAQVLSSRLGIKLENKSNLEAAEKAGTTMKSIKDFMEYREIPKMLKAINTSGIRISQIINNILSFSRRSPIRADFFDILEICDMSLELASTDSELKKEYDFEKIKIIKDYPKNPPLIHCEKSKIQQVFLNILKNGAYAMKGHPNPTFSIKICKKTENKMICTEINDNGYGMDEDQRKRVFEPFFTTKPEGIGTGLGLSLSYFIITENHSGTMSVKSTKGQGSTFRIELPY